MSNQSPFKLGHPLHCIQAPFGSASLLTEDKIINFKLNVQGEGKKLCPYVGCISNDNALFARKPYFDSGVQNGSVPKLPDGNGHLLTIAPTRAGKGTGQIIPNLLSWRGSVLVIDIKGENYLCSAGYRKTVLQQKVFRFAPFEKVSEIWNPILSIRADLNSSESTPEEEEDARYLTNLLITPSGSANGIFWENSAKNFLEGLLLYVRTAPLQSDLQSNDSDNSNTVDSENQHQVHERSMREVRRLLSLKKGAFKKLLSAMSETKRPLIVQAGNNLSRLMSKNGKTGQSILAMTLEQTAVWAYQRLHKVTYKPLAIPTDLEPAPNDFSFEQMRDGNTSIYLIIPPDYLTEYRAVLRVMIGFAMRELRQSFVQYKKDNQDKPPVLFMLDEFPQLAYMRPIEEALLYLAGYDVRFWFFVQDVSQLQLHYKNSWQTFFANTGTQCFFGVSDIATANLVSEMAGMTTTKHTSSTYEPPLMNANKEINAHNELYYRLKDNTSYNLLPSYVLDALTALTNSSQDGLIYFRSKYYPHDYHQLPNVLKSETIANTSRQLITPDEVMRLQEDEQIVFIKGMKPIHCYRPNYYEFLPLKDRIDIEPPHEVDFF